MYEDLKGKKKIVGRFAKDGEQIGDFKDKSTEFSEKKVKSNVEEQKSKGNQGMEIIKAAKDNGRN